MCSLTHLGSPNHSDSLKVILPGDFENPSTCNCFHGPSATTSLGSFYFYFLFFIFMTTLSAMPTSSSWSRTFLGPVALKIDGGCVLRVPFSLLKGKPSGKSKAKSVAEKDLFAEFEEARHYADSLQKATAGWSCWGLILAGRPAELLSQKSVLLTV